VCVEIGAKHWGAGAVSWLLGAQGGRTPLITN